MSSTYRVEYGPQYNVPVGYVRLRIEGQTRWLSVDMTVPEFTAFARDVQMVLDALAQGESSD